MRGGSSPLGNRTAGSTVDITGSAPRHDASRSLPFASYPRPAPRQSIRAHACDNFRRTAKRSVGLRGIRGANSDIRSSVAPRHRDRRTIRDPSPLREHPALSGVAWSRPPAATRKIRVEAGFDSWCSSVLTPGETWYDCHRMSGLRWFMECRRSGVVAALVLVCMAASYAVAAEHHHDEHDGERDACPICWLRSVPATLSEFPPPPIELTPTSGADWPPIWRPLPRSPLPVSARGPPRTLP